MSVLHENTPVAARNEGLRSRPGGRSGLVLLALGLACVGALARMSQSADEQPKASRSTGKPPSANAPQYNAQGELKRPAGFETWVFVGANLGLEYRDDDAPPAKEDAKNDPKPIYGGNFHNVYINPEAYAAYRETGAFPDQTVFVLDIYKAEAGKPKDVVAEGRFPGEGAGIAVAVKNKNRPDGSKTEWAYYEFGREAPFAKAFPNSKCYDCHLEHAKDDCVWTQFYPTLLKARQAREK